MESNPSTLLMTHILQFVPTARHHSLVCSAGSLGYHALKEMLQSGVPGNLVLLENDDLRTMDSDPTAVAGGNPQDWYLYTFEDDGRPPYEERFYWDDERRPLLRNRSQACVFTNQTLFPSAPFMLLEDIETVNMSGLPSFITGIRDSFLEDCMRLTTVDLSPLSNVTALGSQFLYMCNLLKSIDLSPLSQVTSIGPYFMSYCTSLESIDLSPLSNLRAIKGCFFLGCTSLKSIDFRPLSQVESIDECFMIGCTSLQFIDLSMPLVWSIHDPSEVSFLGDCTALKRIDMSAMVLLKTVPQDLVGRFGSSLVLPPHLMK